MKSIMMFIVLMLQSTERERNVSISSRWGWKKRNTLAHIDVCRNAHKINNKYLLTTKILCVIKRTSLWLDVLVPALDEQSRGCRFQSQIISEHTCGHVLDYFFVTGSDKHNILGLYMLC